MKKGWIIGGVIVALVYVGMCVSCTDQTETVSGEDAYSSVIRTGKIRTGYISYPPSFIKDPNTGEYSGIFHEVLQRVAEELSLEVEYTEELGWGTMVESVATGRVDLVCTGLWPTAGRAREAEFTEPVYFSAIKAYCRIDDTRFDGDLSVVNNSDIRIGTIDGEMTSIIARSDFPLATRTSLPQTTDISQLLLEVATNKADITFVEVAVAEEYIANNPNSIKPVPNASPVRVFPNVMMVGKGEYRLLSMLNVAIEELANNGEIERIIEKYEEYPGSFQRRQLPYLP